MTLTGTNTWLIRAPAGTIVVDPGPDDLAHARALEAVGVTAVVLTHRHADHSGALRHLPRDLPVLAADPAYARHVDPEPEGVLVTLAGLDLRVHRTPGHTDDSLCITAQLDDGPVVFTGDTLLGGRHATLVSRHGGDLGQLLASLDRLSRLGSITALPGHGEPIDDLGSHAADALAHRRRRLERLAAEVGSDPAPDLAALARARHPQSPDRWDAAEWTLRVELEHLRRWSPGD